VVKFGFILLTLLGVLSIGCREKAKLTDVDVQKLIEIKAEWKRQRLEEGKRRKRGCKPFSGAEITCYRCFREADQAAAEKELFDPSPQRQKVYDEVFALCMRNALECK